MARFGDSDLPIFFADMGVEVVFGGVTAQGFLDEPELLEKLGAPFGGVTGIQRVLTLPFNAFNPMPQPTQAIAVDGTNYTICNLQASGDGRIVRYGLKGN